MMEYYVSTHGNDNWSGQLPAPNARQTDGPLATLRGARDRLRALTTPPRASVGWPLPAWGQAPWTPRGVPGPITVHIRGGRYFLPEPLTFGPEDSLPVTYAAYAGEKPILDGGQPITGWRMEQVNGVTAWVVDLPEVAAGQWYFHSLFVNGQRRPRPRLPKVGFYHVESVPRLTPATQLTDGSDAFVCAPGHIRAWKNLTDVEVVLLHLWVDEHMPIVSFDEATRLVKCAPRSVFKIEKDRYYVENVFEALTEPGQWYLDRPTGRLYYLPLPGEDLSTAEVFAPRLTQLLRLAGQPGEGRRVQFLQFRGLTFQHTDAVRPRPRWGHDPGDVEPPAGAEAYGQSVENASGPQAGQHIPGVLYLEGAHGCAIEDCAIEQVGWYAVELADGCTANRIVGNELADLGAGGVKLNGANARGPLERRTGNNLVTDNHIHHAGRAFHQAVGVFSRHAFGNVIAHNHIHDLYYSGVSVGWIWGFAENVSKNNRIEKNHIHHLGSGWLSDLGGIYTLGAQPGTVLRGNVIHDIEHAEYGGWAIYPDEGSSHLVIESNICYNTSSQVFHLHYGHENIVRNNIFALGREGVVLLSRTDATVAFSLMRNILVTDGQPLYVAGYGHKLETPNPTIDLNVLWDISRSPIIGRSGKNDHGHLAADATIIDIDRWRKLGNDRHSLVADPLLGDLKQCDFTLAPESPALELGFEPIDVSDVGPRSPEKRQ